MGLSPEWAEHRFGTYPVIDLSMEVVETEGESRISWESKKEKRSITYITFGGGTWESVWNKILIFSSTDPLVGCDLIKIHIIKDNDTGMLTKEIYVDIFALDGDSKKIINYVYSSLTDGLLEESGLVSSESAVDVVDLIETVTTEPIRTKRDLPDRIDIDETIRLLLEQIEERRMTMPVLIAA